MGENIWIKYGKILEITRVFTRYGWLLESFIVQQALRVPVISGNLITAITTGLSGSENVHQIPYYLLFFILACGLQAILFQADLISGSLAKIRQKQWMRTAALEGFSHKSYASSEERGALSSFLNNDIPSLAEDYFGGAVDILKCITLILLSALSLLSIHWAACADHCPVKPDHCLSSLHSQKKRQTGKAGILCCHVLL